MRIPLLRSSCLSALAVGGMLAASIAATPAFAADADNGSTVGEVVVTAQFREQKLQKTPLAISAVTGDTISARGETNVTDIAATVPNTVISPLGAGWGATMAAFIRGVGLGDNILSFEPGVPIYVDDVYNGRPQGSIFDLLDLDRVEVLRGPQGTLFGKNAVGGAVRLISKKPKGDGSGFIEAGYGSYNRINIRGAYDMTVVPDKLFARFSVSSKHADGFMDILDYVCVNGPGSLGSLKSAGGKPSDGCVVDHLGSEGVDSGRAAVRWIAAENVEVNLVADYTRQREESPTDKYTAINNASFEGLWNGVSQALYGPGVLYDSRFVTASPYTTYGEFGTNPVDGRTTPNQNNMDHWGVEGTIDADLAPMVHFKSVTAYRSWWNTFGRSDASPLGNSATFDDTTHSQWTEEVQLTGTVGRLDWADGFFYYSADDANSGYDALLPPGPIPNGFYDHDLNDTQTTKDWAIFTHGVLHITDQLTLTGGVRYTSDKKNALVSVTNLPSSAADFTTPVNVKATRWSPTAELSYQVTPDFMGYFEYSTGFRGGGFSPRPSDRVQATAFGPEDVTNYELGFKSQWLENRVLLNADIFYMTDHGQQNFKADIDSLGNQWFHEVNAGNSVNEGFEVELKARPITGLQIDTSLGYLRYRLQSNAAQRTVLLCTTFSDGSPCPQTRAPAWNFSVGAQYRIDMGNSGSLTPRLDLTGISRVYYGTFSDSCSVTVAPGAACPAANVVAPPPPSTLLSTAASGVPGAVTYQPGYMLLNGRITWTAPDDKWSVSLSGSNLTNKAYFYGKLALYSLLGREQGNIAPPRQWLLTVRRDF